MFLNSVGPIDQFSDTFQADSSRFSFASSPMLSAAASFAVLSQMQQVVGSVVESEMFELIEIMIRYGHNPDGIPALHYAIKMEDERAVKLLLDHGADPNAKARDINRWSEHFPEEKPLMAIEYAAVTGNMNIIRMLVDEGAIIKDYEEYNPCFHHFYFTPLRYAIISDHPKVIAYLVSCGALGDGLFHDQEELSAAVLTAVRYGSINVLEWLKKEGVNYKQQNVKNPHLVHIAVQSNQPKILEFLLGERLNPNGKYPGSDQTPLHDAVRLVNLECIDLLIDFNSDPNALDCSGNTPLGCAIIADPQKPIFDVVKKLIDLGANVNHVGSYGTPLISAVQQMHHHSNYSSKYMKCCEYLLSHGANINAADKYGRNVLFYAKQNKNQVLIDWLIAHGARD
ncbi:MAG: ankyrin repeat domain-containing protein [Parachlamydiales bacterium]|nr:ankyrin repeat domain-containing protein [Candidatus Acheromyda pituitae]